MSSSCIAWLASARISASSAARLGGAFSRAASSRKQQAGKRLVDLIVEVPGDPGPLLLLRREGGVGGAPALRLEPLEHPREGVVQSGDLLRVGGGADRAQVRARARQVGALHLVDQLLERLEAALDQRAR